MIYKKVFADSDVLLDLLLQRAPFFTFSQAFLNKGKRNIFQISTSSLIIANIHYVLSKSIGKQPARQSIGSLINMITVLPFELDAISLAINSEFVDFEDAIQHCIAQKYNCDVIISRNLKHYKKSHLPVLNTEQFLRTL